MSTTYYNSGYITEIFSCIFMLAYLIHEVHHCFVEKDVRISYKNISDKAKSECPEVVANGAKWATEILLKQSTNYR